LEERVVYASIAVGEKFIAACPGYTKKVHVFDRQSQERVHVLYDSDNYEYEV
jgi:hypothetical protein